MFSIECVLYRPDIFWAEEAEKRNTSGTCSLQNVFSTEHVLYRMYSLQNVFAYLMFSRQKKPRKEIPVPQIHERTRSVKACTVISP
jgi:hypothetical protein